jgi:hypothetical protein
MTKLPDLAAVYVDTSSWENQNLSYTILDEQGNEVMHQSFPYVPHTIEEIKEFMAWEERLLKESMGLPKKNC